jgi:hypothetical protein
MKKPKNWIPAVANSSTPEAPQAAPARADDQQSLPAKRRPPSWEEPQISIRVPKETRRRLNIVAASLDKTAKDVVLEALNLYLDRQGLHKLD